MQLNLPVLPGRASCANPDFEPEWWTSDPEAPENAANTAQAKLICARCPVLQSCLEHALGQDELGIWGGMTHRERAWYRKRYQIVIGTTPSLFAVQAKSSA